MNETTNGGAKPPQCIGGLCIAIVNKKSDIDNAASRLTKEMDCYGAHTGILLVGSEFARSPFGPIPQDWLRRGIGIVVGESDDLDAEAETLFDEYKDGLVAVEASLRRLGETAREEGLPTGSNEPEERKRVRDPVNNEQIAKPVSAAQAAVAARAPLRQPRVTGSMSGAMQSSAPQGAMHPGAQATAGSVQGCGAQGGSMQGGSCQDDGMAQGEAGGAEPHASGGRSRMSGGETRGPTRREGKT